MALAPTVTSGELVWACSGLRFLLEITLLAGQPSTEGLAVIMKMGSSPGCDQQQETMGMAIIHVVPAVGRIKLSGPATTFRVKASLAQ